MKERKILALILVIVLVMSSFTFAFAKTTNWIKVRGVDSTATTVVVVFKDATPDLSLDPQGGHWNGADNKKFVYDNIEAILVDGEPVTFIKGTEAGGTININVGGFIPKFGTITIDKTVTGNQRDENQVFTFEIRDDFNNLVDTVTASALIDGVSISLIEGDYTVIEVDHAPYQPASNNIPVTIVDGNKTVNFTNDYHIDPPTEGTLIIHKEVFHNGVKQDEDQEVFTFIIYEPQLQPVSMQVSQYRTVTASAITSGSIILPAGDYIVEEISYYPYSPRTTSQSIEVTNGDVINVTFKNDLSIDEPTEGTLIIHKEVFHNGVKQDEDQVVFTFIIYDPQLQLVSMQGSHQTVVTASAITSGSITLPEGNYIVEEISYYPYSPRTTSQSIEVTNGDVTNVTFKNDLSIDEPTEGTLIIHKEVFHDGVRQVEDQEVFTFIIYDPQLQPVSMQVSEYRTVTASAISSGSIILPAGDYIVEEISYDPYSPRTTSQSIEVTAGVDTEVTFENDLVSGIKIIKDVTGNQSKESDDFIFDIVPYGEVTPSELQTVVVTASKETSGYSGYLEPGRYLVTERASSTYWITSISSSNTYDSDVERGIIVNVSEGTQTVVNFTNRYNVSSSTTTTTSPPPPPEYKIEIEKTADADLLSLGDVITYTITVTNIGNATLTNVSVIDGMVGLDEFIATLGVNESVSYTREYITTAVGTLENIATATSNETQAVQDKATVIVIVEQIPEGSPSVPEIEEPVEVVPEEEVPLAIPATGGSSSMLAYGAGAMLSLLGLLKKKRR